MPTKRATKKRSATKKAGPSATGKKSSSKKSRSKADSKGIINTATKVVRNVVVAAVAGAAEVVKGAAEAGSKVTGIDGDNKWPKRQSRAKELFLSRT